MTKVTVAFRNFTNAPKNGARRDLTQETLVCNRTQSGVVIGLLTWHNMRRRLHIIWLTQQSFMYVWSKEGNLSPCFVSVKPRLHWHTPICISQNREQINPYPNHSFSSLSYYSSIANSKGVLHRQRSNASSFNFQYPLVFFKVIQQPLTSSSSSSRHFYPSFCLSIY